MNVSVAILRVPEGLDFTGHIADFNLSDITSGKQKTGVDNPQFNQDDVSTISGKFGNGILKLSQGTGTRQLNCIIYSFSRCRD